MVSLAERYEEGKHEIVWRALRDLGPAAFEPRWHDDAAKVAALTMERVAANVATVVVRLTMMGYRFGGRYNRNQRRRSIEDLGLRDTMARAGRDVAWIDAGEVEEHVMGWQAPSSEVHASLDRLEKTTGPLPLALHALIEHVDAVDLSGSFPGWDPSAYDFDDPDWPRVGVSSDPLNFSGVELISEFVRADPAFVDPAHSPAPRSLSMPIAANHELSANLAGAYHCVLLPELVADPEVEGVFGRPGITLVQYLRVAFAWGGFPGFEHAGHRPRELDVLARGLLPF